MLKGENWTKITHSKNDWTIALRTTSSSFLCSGDSWINALYIKACNMVFAAMTAEFPSFPSRTARTSTTSWVSIKEKFKCFFNENVKFQNLHNGFSLKWNDPHLWDANHDFENTHALFPNWKISRFRKFWNFSLSPFWNLDQWLRLSWDKRSFKKLG